VDEQRELATNRLLEIIRSGRGAEGGAPGVSETTAPVESPEAPVAVARFRTPEPNVVREELHEVAEAAQSAAPRPTSSALEELLRKARSTPPSTPTPEPPPTVGGKPIRIEPLEPPRPPSEPGPLKKIEDAPEFNAAELEMLLHSSPLQDLWRKVERQLKPRRSPKSDSPPTSGKASPPKEKKPPLHIGAKGKRIFVLDIGSAAVKVVELVRSGTTLQIVALDQRTIPIGMRKAGGGSGLLMSKLIGELLPSSRLKKAELRAILPDRSSVVRRVSVPGGAAKELANAIKFQIKKDLPFALDTCEVAHRGWNPKEKGKQELEILAVDGKVLNERMSWLEQSELVPSTITAAPAANRALVRDYAGIPTGPGAVLCVDIGAAKTAISILEGSTLIFARTFASGGDDFTAALTGAPLGPSGEELTEPQAEKYKIDIGLPGDRDTALMRAAVILRPVVERLSTEINRSLDVYRRDRSGAEVSKMLLFGGGSQLKRLPEFLSENIGLDVIVGSPLSRLQAHRSRASEVMEAASEAGPVYMPALAVGLDDGKSLSILPAALKTQLKLKAARAVITPILLGLMGLLTLFYASALRRSVVVERDYEKVHAEIADLDKVRGQFLEAEAQVQDLTRAFAERRQDFESIRIGEPEIPRYLKAISNLVPDNIYLVQMQTLFVPEVEEKSSNTKKSKSPDEPAGFNIGDILTSFSSAFGSPLTAGDDSVRARISKRPIFGRVLELEGNLYPQGRLTDVQLVDFVFTLENSGHFRDVAVDSVAVLANGRLRFRILCGI